MKKLFFILAILYSVHFSCVAQKEIIYEVESPVLDSIQSGIKMYEELLNKKASDLKLFMVFIENNNEFEIYLQEYSQMPQSGFVDLITTSNRKLICKSKQKIPILVPTDKLSLQIKKDKIANLPVSGFYLKFIYENYKQKVIKTSILF
jgi:hypothetical protein